ncbi:MAG: hypothetical protein NTU57_02285 [Candidatus Aenigmarchaeota archaeon]|nr:hypothetical protein [Candidatus Aenigmarchaeota archaeon]
MRTFEIFGLEAAAGDRPERPFPLRPGREFEFPVQDADQLLYTIIAANASTAFNDVFEGIQEMPYGG